MEGIDGILNSSKEIHIIVCIICQLSLQVKGGPFSALEHLSLLFNLILMQRSLFRGLTKQHHHQIRVRYICVQFAFDKYRSPSPFQYCCTAKKCWVYRYLYTLICGSDRASKFLNVYAFLAELSRTKLWDKQAVGSHCDADIKSSQFWPAYATTCGRFKLVYQQWKTTAKCCRGYIQPGLDG